MQGLGPVIAPSLTKQARRKAVALSLQHVFVGRADLRLSAFLDALTLFGLGYSWGGFESLAIPVKLKGIRTATEPKPDTLSIRLHIGLEDPADLITDLAQAFDKAFG